MRAAANCDSLVRPVRLQLQDTSPYQTLLSGELATMLAVPKSLPQRWQVTKTRHPLRQLVLLLFFRRCQTVDLTAGQMQSELLVVCESPTASRASFGTLLLVDYSGSLVVSLAAKVSFGSWWNFFAAPLAALYVHALPRSSGNVASEWQSKRG